MNRYPPGNHNANHNPNNDPLVCAVEAMRHQPTPDGPPPEVEARLLHRISQLDDQAQSPPPLPGVQTTVRERTFKMPSLTKYAAAILAVGILAVVAIVNLIPSTPAFADVRANVLATRTMSCVMVLNFEKAPQPGAPKRMELKLIAKNPGWLRQEISMPHPQHEGQEMTMVQVISYEDGKILSLMPSEKVATEIKFDLNDFGQQPQNFNIVDEFSKMDDEDGKYLRTETVDGKELLVYQIDHNAGKTISNTMFPEDLALKATMWVDADSRLPVRMKMDMSGSMGMKLEMKDFEWDIDVPDSLLSLEIPPGYQKHSMDMAGITEKDLAHTLKIWAESNDGVFPDDFNQTALQNTMVKIAKSLDGKPNEQDILKLTQEFTRGFMFVATFMEGGEFKYQGKGVILGEDDRIICYFRKKDETNYRVIFGDLSVGELTSEDLKGRAED